MEKNSGNHKQKIVIDKRIDTLFIRLTAIYGNVWLRSFQNEVILDAAKKEWNESLNPFSTHTIKEALYHVKKHNHFPPSLPEFVDCCKTISARYKSTTFRPEVVKKANPELVREQLNKMKNYINLP